MDDQKTEAQLRAAAMLLAIEEALNDQYEGRVFSSGSLWDRKIAVWLNDLEEMVIDFSTEDGIRVRIINLDKRTDTDDSGIPDREFMLEPGANLEEIQDFIKDVVTDTASAVYMDPKSLVYRIVEVVTNARRMQQAATNLEAPEDVVPTPFQPL
jgi:hypothetical protein